MSLEWPSIQPERHVQLGQAPLPEDANSGRLGSAPHGPPHWRRDVLQPPVVPGASLPGTHVFTFRLEACNASLGKRYRFLVLLPPLNSPVSRSIFTSRGWPEENDIICRLENHR